jgi:hypothetical protein
MDDQRWQAVVSRDARFDGQLFSRSSRRRFTAARHARRDARDAIEFRFSTFPMPLNRQVFVRVCVASHVSSASSIGKSNSCRVFAGCSIRLRKTRQ